MKRSADIDAWRRPVLVATAVAMVASLPLAGRAQSPAEPRSPPQALGATDVRSIKVAVPGVILAEPASETALPITLSPPDIVPRNGLLRIRGLPPTAALSEGHAIAPGAWAVPISAAGRLRITLPVGYAGKTDITVMVVTLDGALLAETRSALVVTAATLGPPETVQPGTRATTEPPPAIASVIQHYTPPAQPAEPPAAAPPSREVAPPTAAQSTPSAEARTKSTPPAAPGRQVAALPPQEPSAPPAVSAPLAPTPPQISADTRARLMALMKRGEALRKDGNIIEARALFERAADEGLPEAALALGGTYDPYELSQVRVRGLKPDPTQARRWYEKAKTLGSGEAQARIERLP